MDWQTCFAMEAGKTYRIRFVYRGDSVVNEASVRFDGDVMPGNSAVVIALDGTAPGAISVLQIDEIAAGASIEEAS